MLQLQHLGEKRGPEAFQNFVAEQIECSSEHKTCSMVITYDSVTVYIAQITTNKKEKLRLRTLKRYQSVSTFPSNAVAAF